MPGNIFIITGPSGVGKGTLCELLLQADPALRLSISATSRAMRPGERDGVNYYFKTREAFEALIAQDAQESDPERHHLLEWAQYNGHYYGTPRAEVQAALSEERHVLLEIDVQGALQVRHHYPDALLIFILPPDEPTLLQRLTDRDRDSAEDINKRFRAAKREIHMAKGSRAFDYMVINDKLDRAVEEVSKIIKHRRAGGI